MHRYKILILISILFFNSCIEEFKPALDKQEINKYVINGKITNQEGYHVVYISKSSEIDNPQKNPVSNCDVKIKDDQGNIFQLSEYEKGEYKAFIEKSYLKTGNAIKIEIITPEGDLIQSEYDTLTNCPEISDFYYSIEERLTSDPENDLPTIQFYIDYNGSNSNARFIKWNLEETWEYHSEYPLKWYYDGIIHMLEEPDYSKQICWTHRFIPENFILSTENITENIYFKFPLHSIPNTSNKLAIGYSLLIKQYALSKSAYIYYEKLNSNIINDGGLYESQPQQIKGNLLNVTNPDETVLGYFEVSGIQTKRIYFEPIIDFPLNMTDICEPTPVYIAFLKGAYCYIWISDDVYFLDDHCVDCTVLGGTTEKPEYWPN